VTQRLIYPKRSPNPPSSSGSGSGFFSSFLAGLASAFFSSLAGAELAEADPTLLNPSLQS